MGFYVSKGLPDFRGLEQNWSSSPKPGLLSEGVQGRAVLPQGPGLPKGRPGLQTLP